MDSRLLSRSVQDLEERPFNNTITLNLGITGQPLIEPWGRDWIRRDMQLAEFWPTEPFLASAITSIVMTRASLTWQLEGPPKSVSAVRRILNQSDFGKGWSSLMVKICLDILTQDNGAFIEIIRDKARPGTKPQSAPVLGLAHLPSMRCVRTGNPLKPVIYITKKGKYRELKWYQVITLEELPSTIPDALDRQVCFVSRVLKAAEIIRDITTYQSEKVSGRFTRAMHLVGGVAQPEIDRIQERGEIDADNRGLARYAQPLILAALDPNAKVSHVQIDLATLPDAFDFDETMKWYISVIAMAAGGDFQDFAPLPGGDLGTASQSETLHRKSQRKGHALFMKMVENRLMQGNVFPRNVTFRFNQQDAAAELELAEIAKVRAETRATQIDSGEITPEIARLIAVDKNDLKHSHLIDLNGINDEQDITLDEDEQEPQEIEQNKALSIEIAQAAARAVKSLVENHPMNDYMSISEDLLNLFEIELRNEMITETRLTTGEAWQCTEITRAARNSGIQPHLIRLRLPDNLVLVANKNGVYSNFAGQIYTKQKRVQPRPVISPYRIAKGEKCYKCKDNKETYAYIATKGWVPVCKKHSNQGLVGRLENPQFDKAELLYAFKKQFDVSDKKLALFVSSMAYANELNTGDIDLNRIREVTGKIKDVITVLPATILAQYLL